MTKKTLLPKKSNRDHVVEVASTLFLTRGVAQTSMDEVVSESGIAKSNIYYHFKSKEELLLAVVDHRIRVFEKNMMAIIQDKTVSPTQRISLLVTTITTDMAGRNCIGGCPFLSLAIQVSGTHQTVRARVSRFFDDLRLLMSRTLQAGIEAGELRGDILVEHLAYTVVSTLEGAIMLAELRKDPTLIEMAGSVILKLLQPGI